MNLTFDLWTWFYETIQSVSYSQTVPFRHIHTSLQEISGFPKWTETLLFLFQILPAGSYFFNYLDGSDLIITGAPQTIRTVIVVNKNGCQSPNGQENSSTRERFLCVVPQSGILCRQISSQESRPIRPDYHWSRIIFAKRLTLSPLRCGFYLSVLFDPSFIPSSRVEWVEFNAPLDTV